MNIFFKFCFIHKEKKVIFFRYIPLLDRLRLDAGDPLRERPLRERELDRDLLPIIETLFN